MQSKIKLFIPALAGFVVALSGCANTASTTMPTAPENSEQQPTFQASIYRLNIGDSVEVKVFQEPDLSGEFTVESDGNINYPLLGRVGVASRTTSGVETQLRQGLSAGFLVNPDVRVTVVAYKPIFVGGEVKRPGEYPFKPGLNAQQAVTLAGGMTRFASEKYYIQRNETGPDDRFRATADTSVYPGDIITIEERLF